MNTVEFTSKDLLKAMNLKIGDRVKDCCHTYEIINDDWLCLKVMDSEYKIGSEICNITNLLGRKFEILYTPKRVGDLKCSEYGNKNCNSCPIRVICIDDFTDDTLYNKLELAHKYAKDQEIYDLLKARLDKEVNDND